MGSLMLVDLINIMENDVYSLKEILNIENINISVKDKFTEEIIVHFIK